jgi:hypothetical protein
MSEADRTMRLLSVAILAFIVLGVGIAALAASTADEREPEPPESDWTVDRLNETHVFVEMVGGEPIRSEDFVVSVDGLQRQVRLGEGYLYPGSGFAIAVERGQVIRLTWDPAPGQRATLFTHTVGESPTPAPNATG